MGSVSGLARLLVVLAVALQSFGVLRDIHASHTHHADLAIAATGCDGDPGHTHSTETNPSERGLPASPDEDCPTCDLLAVVLKGWTTPPPALPVPAATRVVFLAEAHDDPAPTRRWSPSRSRDPPMNENRAV